MNNLLDWIRYQRFKDKINKKIWFWYDGLKIKTSFIKV